MTSHDALQDVPDPTDWNGTLLPGLADVEAPLRCQVCKEFMTAPMMTSCGHTFCSACIRRYLAGAGICPACKTKDQEINLKKNKSMEEVVEAFQRARVAMLEVAKTQPSIEPTSNRKKRSIASQESSQQEPNKRTRSSARIASRTSPEVRYDGVDLTEEKEDKDEKYAPPLDDGLVACPMCEKRMKEAFINRHLDDVHFNPPPSRNLMNSLSISSPQRSQKQPQQQPHQKPITAPQSSQPKQLPNLNYHLYNETKLRAKLRELGIPNSGNKPMMEKRHREWLTLWNANCDATHPKSKNELLRQLNEWERAEERQFNLNHYNTNPRDSQVQNKKFDRDQWAKRHEGDFEHLIANARKNAQKNKEALAKKQKAEESKDQQVGFTDSGPAPQQESTAQPSNKESNATPEILYTQQPQTLPVTGPQESASEEGGMLPLMPVSNMPRHQPNSREMTVEELREFGQLPPWEPTFRPDYARDDAGFLRHLPQEDGVPPLEDYLSEARDAR